MPYLPPTSNATAVPRRLQALSREVSAAQAATSGQVNATVHELKQMLATVAAQQTKLQETVDLLFAAAQVKSDEFTTWKQNFLGWYTGAVPTVQVSSPSGRIEIIFGGSGNGGGAIFCYQVTNAATGAIIVNRTSILNSNAKRVEVMGGASYTPSGFGFQVVTVPKNTPVSVSLQLYATDTFSTFAGGSIMARASL